MTKILKSKYRASRALCQKPLWGTAKDPANTRNYRPGQHGQGHKKKSDFAMQLIAKQTVKKYYYIMEKPFRNMFKKAAKRKGNTSLNLLQSLESRLDAVVYRATFGKTVFASRQLVSHGHVTVNGKKVKVRSYSVKPGDVVAIRDKSKNIATIVDSVENSERSLPDYVQIDDKKLEAKYIRYPESAEEVPYAVRMEELFHLIVEFYSK